MPNKVARIFLPRRDLYGDTGIRKQQPMDEASWVWHPDAGRDERAFLIFKRSFSSTGEPLVIHVSADERYELFLDGQRISRGPDRSDVEHWAYASYSIELEPGEHTLSALAWTLLQDGAPIAQLSWRGGFVLKADGPYHESLTTGIAPWTAAKAGGWKALPVSFGMVFGAGACFEWSGGAAAAGPELPAKVVKEPVKDNKCGVASQGWKLFPSSLPEQTSKFLSPGRPVAAGEGVPGQGFQVPAASLKSPRLESWRRLLRGEDRLSIPPGSEEFVLIDLEDYYTGYPVLEVSGGQGSVVSWSWTESLYEATEPPWRMPKGDRSAVAGKYWLGMTDVFPLDGGTLSMSVPWWRAGRYVLITAKTAAQSLDIRRIAVEESRYPLEMEASFSSDDEPALKEIQRICVRGMQMCSHETYMDCPYFEQLMYVGDTRVEMLANHAMSADSRLVMRGVELFDFSRVNWGFVNERYPSSKPQHSPTFSLIWAIMLHDFVHWREADGVWLKARMTGLRSMLEQFQPYLTEDGLLEKIPGWPFMDWVAEWDTGNPPGAVGGISCAVNLLYILALRKAAELEEIANEPLLAKRHSLNASRCAEAVLSRFWSKRRKMLADDLDGKEFSEHSQALGMLSGTLRGAKAKQAFRALLEAPDLRRASSYFSFYLFETFRLCGRADLIQSRLSLWKEMLELGCKTPLEHPEPSRSDCHAWSSHILFHLLASVAGVRPGSPGFKTVMIEPQPGLWKGFDASMPHPSGFVRLKMEKKGEGFKTLVELPEGVEGEFLWNGTKTLLKPGKQSLLLPCPVTP